ncbi:hypothetical protein ABTM70_20860, partial [Acinetobacter baumannii]
NILKRGVALSAGNPNHATGVVYLAAAHMLANQPRQASAVLTNHRAAVIQEPFRKSTAFLDSLVRYRLLPDKREGQTQ